MSYDAGNTIIFAETLIDLLPDVSVLTSSIIHTGLQPGSTDYEPNALTTEPQISPHLLFDSETCL